MWVGTALVAGGIIYFAKLLANYEDYGDHLRKKRKRDREVATVDIDQPFECP